MRGQTLPCLPFNCIVWPDDLEWGRETPRGSGVPQPLLPCPCLPLPLPAARSTTPTDLVALYPFMPVPLLYVAVDCSPCNPVPSFLLWLPVLPLTLPSMPYWGLPYPDIPHVWPYRCAPTTPFTPPHLFPYPIPLTGSPFFLDGSSPPCPSFCGWVATFLPSLVPFPDLYAPFIPLYLPLFRDTCYSAPLTSAPGFEPYRLLVLASHTSRCWLCPNS